MNGLNSGPWVLVEDLSSVYNDVEVERGAVKHAHKKRKLTDGREKTMVSPNQKSFQPECMKESFNMHIYFVHVYLFFNLNCRVQMMRKAWGKVEGGTF